LIFFQVDFFKKSSQNGDTRPVKIAVYNLIQVIDLTCEPEYTLKTNIGGIS